MGWRPNGLALSRRLEWTRSVDRETVLAVSRCQNRSDPAGRLQRLVSRRRSLEAQR
jgi:hypothetical protein